MQRAFRIAAAAALLAVAGCLPDDSTAPVVPPTADPATVTYAPSLNIKIADMTKTSTGLYYQDVVVGTGTVAAAGDSIGVHYSGWFTNGSLFDTSRNSGVPIRFRLGRGRVIAGWDEGLAGMRVGGRRRLVIPPALGYGEAGYLSIPGNAVLVFDVELVNRYSKRRGPSGRLPGRPTRHSGDTGSTAMRR